MKKILSFFTRPLGIILGLAVIFAAWGAVAYFGGGQSAYEFVEVERGTVEQIVSVTGKVKAADAVDLAFEKSGKVASISVKVGDQVSAGQILASLDNAELAAQLAQARATLASQQAKLNEYRIGTRPEEIQSAETTVANAQKTLSDAQTNYDNAVSKADADLRSTYDGALSAAANSVSVAINSLYVITDIQQDHFLSSDQNSNNLAAAKAEAVKALLGADNAGKWQNAYLSVLNGGAKLDVQTAQANPAFDNIDAALSSVKTALEKVQTTLNAIPIVSDLSTTDRTNLSTEKAAINAEITTVAGKIQTINVQKATNSNNITTARITLTSAQNSLATAQDTLTLKKAGYTSEQIASQEAQVKSAQANADSYAAQLGKTVIRSPLAGIVTKQDAKVGEIISANANLVSVLSGAKFEIEANVSENEIAKLELENEVKITLDALGSEEKFVGRIVQIDPAETIVSGVIYYKVTSVFDVEDSRIKSGMTANLDIQTDKKTDVLVLPYYLVKEKNSHKYVQVLEEGKEKEQVIETGLEGETLVEITSGLSEGQKVITNEK
ncbi:MAG: efflux RND transporter periplasmic adaptor subunit [Candidatus Portnoybacteria bacterium]|nr:efflux RND transporter periplasmic adaptor subunit [Candidatus Portnoybacteria bacterium]